MKGYTENSSRFLKRTRDSRLLVETAFFPMISRLKRTARFFFFLTFPFPRMKKKLLSLENSAYDPSSAGACIRMYSGFRVQRISSAVPEPLSTNDAVVVSRSASFLRVESRLKSLLEVQNPTSLRYSFVSRASRSHCLLIFGCLESRKAVPAT